MGAHNWETTPVRHIFETSALDLHPDMHWFADLQPKVGDKDARTERAELTE